MCKKFFLYLTLLLLDLILITNSAPTTNSTKNHEISTKRTRPVFPAKHKPKPEEMSRLFEGDIELSEDEEKQLLDNSRIESTVTAEREMWEGGLIPYEFSNDFDLEDREIVEGAIREIEEKTCVRFEEREEEIDDFIRFEDGAGCSSKVGKKGGEQIITLSHEGCVHHGTAIHEIVHALGFWHEQSRLDRDKYVEIKWDNIQPDKFKNFRKYVSTETEDYQVSYDYGSVMHYKADAFQRDDTDEDTIVPKEDGVEIGQRRELSKLDAEKINRMYCKKDKNKLVTKAPTTTTVDPEYEDNENDYFNFI